jgi:hypothetical protein
MWAWSGLTTNLDGVGMALSNLVTAKHQIQFKFEIPLFVSSSNAPYIILIQDFLFL